MERGTTKVVLHQFLHRDMIEPIEQLELFGSPTISIAQYFWTNEKVVCFFYCSNLRNINEKKS